MLCLQMKSLTRLSPLSRRLLAAFGTRTFKVRFDSAHQAFVPLPMAQSEVRAFPKSQFELAHFQLKNELQLFKDSDDKKVDSKFKAGDQHWAAFNFQPVPRPNTAESFQGILRQERGYFDNSQIIRLVIPNSLNSMCLFAPPRFGLTTGLRMLQAFLGIPFKNGQIDELKMLFFAQSFQKLKICKNSTKQQWQEYKTKYMHKFVVLRIQFPEVNQGTTQKEVTEDLIKIITSQLNQVGATKYRDKFLIHQAKNMSQLAMDTACILKSNAITKQNQPILIFDQTERAFQKIKELHRLSSDEAEKEQLMRVYHSFVNFINRLTKCEHILCIIAGSQPFYQNNNTTLNNLLYKREWQFYEYFLPTTQEFEQKVKQDFPLSATREELKLVSRLYNGYRQIDKGYTNLHSAFQLLANRDHREYVQENSSVSPHFRLLMKRDRYQLKNILTSVAFKMVKWGNRRYRQDAFKRVITNLHLDQYWLQIELMQEGVIIFNDEGRQTMIQPLNLKKAKELLRFIGTGLPFQISWGIQEQLTNTRISRASLSLGQMDAACRVVVQCLKGLVPQGINSRSDMAAAFGSGFSYWDNKLSPLRADVRRQLLAGQMNNVFYSFDKEQAALAQYKFCQYGSKKRLIELADEAIRQIIHGCQNQGKKKMGVAGEGGFIKLDSQSLLSTFKAKKQIQRIFVAGVAMNSRADCCWEVIELELRREAQSLQVRQVGRTSGSMGNSFGPVTSEKQSGGKASLQSKGSKKTKMGAPHAK